jgi:hypothetical protein
LKHPIIQKGRNFGFLLFFFGSVFAQNYTQTVKGRVIDQDTKAPIFGAKVFILNTSPTFGTTSDAEGYFSLEKVPIGRYDFKILYIGYFCKRSCSCKSMMYE